MEPIIRKISGWTPSQNKILFSDKRFRQFVAHTRGGKTALIPPLIAQTQLRYPGEHIFVLICLPDERMINRVIVEQYIKRLSPNKPSWWEWWMPGVYNDSKRIYKAEGITIFLAGLHGRDQINKIEGIAYHLAIIDECFQCREDDLSVAISRTFERKGICYFCSTPYERCSWMAEWTASTGRADNWELVELSAYDSLLFSKEDIDEMRDTMPDWLFRMRFLADTNARPEGLCLNWKSENILKERPGGWKASEYFAGLDIGSTKHHPAAFLLFERFHNKTIIVDEYYGALTGSQAYADKIKEVLLRNQVKPENCPIGVDNSAKHLIHDLQTYHQLAAYSAHKPKVLDGVQALQEQINQGLCYLQYDCPDLHLEIGRYSMDEEKGQPRDCYNHAIDACRYGLLGRKKAEIESHAAYSFGKRENFIDTY